MTVPVWVTAAACAATNALLGNDFEPEQSISVPDCAQQLLVPVISVALLDGGKQALAISKCESASALDLTRGLEIWTLVQWEEAFENPAFMKPEEDLCLNVVGGQGVGYKKTSGEISISQFALDILKLNLNPLTPLGKRLRLEVIFPKGKELSSRTSNESFGIVDGLALIGTQAEIQISASPSTLDVTRKALRKKCSQKDFGGDVTYVIGENGLDLIKQLGLDGGYVLKVGNWLGPMIVEAAQLGVQRLLLFGYHGKLIKLAGGIFHTHHHLADGRLEVLTSLAVQEGLPLSQVRLVNQAQTVEEGFKALEAIDGFSARKLWKRVAISIEERSAAYIARYGSWPMKIGVALFDRKRRLRSAGPLGSQQLSGYGLTVEDIV